MFVVCLGIEKEPFPNKKGFFRGNIGMIVRRVARNHVPDSAHDESNDCTEPKGRAPALERNTPGKQGWSQPGSCADARKDPAVCDTTLTYRKPSGNKLVRCRIDDGLSRAQRQAHTDQQWERSADLIGHHGSQNREN